MSNADKKRVVRVLFCGAFYCAAVCCLWLKPVLTMPLWLIGMVIIGAPPFGRLEGK